MMGSIMATPKVLELKLEMTRAKVMYLVIVCQNAAFSCGESVLNISFAAINVKR